jgi:hypothetical protein
MTCKEKISLKFLMMALTVCCFGCSGGGTDIDLGTVTGVVTLDGKPLADAVVVFAPDNGNASSDQTDASGKYQLTYNKNAKGALLGKHKVSITEGQPAAAELGDDADLSKVDLSATGDIGDASTKGGKGKKSMIPAKYNTKTTLTADVKTGANTFDFKLDSK